MGIAVNTLLALIKITAGILGNAYALIADGIESMLDIGSSIILWGGLKVAARPPDASHPYGHGKAEPLAAILVAVSIVVAAVLLAVQTVRELLTPHHSPAPFTLLVLVLVILTKEILFRFVIRTGTEARSTAISADAWHHRSDAITSAAAFIGISIALVGGERFATADDWAALGACGLIAFNGVRMFIPALYEIMDTAHTELEAEIRSNAASVPGVAEIETCRIRKMGLAFYIDLHVRVDGNLSVRTGHEIAHAVKNRLRASNPAVADVLVHIEPARI